MKNKNYHSQDATNLDPPRDVAEEIYYSRQTLLKEISTTGQHHLKKARLAVIGAGALGCSALPYLTSAGIGKIGIFDDDKIELSNLNRQTLYRYKDVGKKKATQAAARLKELNPFIEISGTSKRLKAANIHQLLEKYDLIIDGSDNLATKLLLSDFCFAHRKPLVSAGISRFNAHIHVFTAFDQGCLRCLWSAKISESVGREGCSELGILGSVAAIVGSIQAHEALKIILGLPRQSDDILLLVDLLAGTYKKIKKMVHKDCPCCSQLSSSTITEQVTLNVPNDPSTYEGAAMGKRGFDIDIDQLRNMKDFVLLDIRDEELSDVPLNISIPIQTIPHWDIDAFRKLPDEKNYVLVCQSGSQSKLLARELKIKFPQKKFFALKAGFGDLNKTS